MSNCIDKYHTSPSVLLGGLVVLLVVHKPGFCCPLGITAVLLNSYDIRSFQISST